jgi:hypothetical protein
MPVSYDDDGTDNAMWMSGNGTAGDDFDDLTGSLDQMVSMPPVNPKAPKMKGPSSKQSSSSSNNNGAMVNFVDLDKLLKGPIEEVWRNNEPGDAEFLVAHMKSSLAGLAPTIESFEA